MPTNRTFIELAEKFYTGTTIYYIKRFSPISDQLKELYQMSEGRKNPKGLLGLLDCSEESIGAIENALFEKLDLILKILIFEHPGLGMDVDKPKDYIDALKILPANFDQIEI